MTTITTTHKLGCCADCNNNFAPQVMRVVSACNQCYKLAEQPRDPTNECECTEKADRYICPRGHDNIKERGTTAHFSSCITQYDVNGRVIPAGPAMKCVYNGPNCSEHLFKANRCGHVMCVDCVASTTRAYIESCIVGDKIEKMHLVPDERGFLVPACVYCMKIARSPLDVYSFGSFDLFTQRLQPRKLYKMMKVYANSVFEATSNGRSMNAPFVPTHPGTRVTCAISERAPSTMRLCLCQTCWKAGQDGLQVLPEIWRCEKCNSTVHANDAETSQKCSTPHCVDDVSGEATQCYRTRICRARHVNTKNELVIDVMPDCFTSYDRYSVHVQNADLRCASQSAQCTPHIFKSHGCKHQLCSHCLPQSMLLVLSEQSKASVVSQMIPDNSGHLTLPCPICRAFHPARFSGVFDHRLSHLMSPADAARLESYRDAVNESIQ